MGVRYNHGEGVSLVLPDKDSFQKLLVSRGVARPVLLHILKQTVLQHKCVVFTIELANLHTEKTKKKSRPILSASVRIFIIPHF